jgi:hypothetical protein
MRYLLFVVLLYGCAEGDTITYICEGTGTATVSSDGSESQQVCVRPPLTPDKRTRISDDKPSEGLSGGVPPRGNGHGPRFPRDDD